MKARWMKVGALARFTPTSPHTYDLSAVSAMRSLSKRTRFVPTSVFSTALLDRKSTRLNSSHSHPTRRSYDLGLLTRRTCLGRPQRELSVRRINEGSVDEGWRFGSLHANFAAHVRSVGCFGDAQLVEAYQVRTDQRLFDRAPRSEEHTSELQSLPPYTTLLRSRPPHPPDLPWAAATRALRPSHK